MERWQKFMRLSFWFSLAFHIIILVLLLFYFVSKPDIQKPANDYIQAYVYKEKPIPTIQHYAGKRSSAKPNKQKVVEEIKQEEAKLDVAEKKKTEELPLKTSTEKKAREVTFSSIIASTYNVLDQMQTESLKQGDEMDPIYLIGEENGIQDPFVILIGKALSAHFHYPQEQGELGTHGIVYISLTVHPEGYFSQVHIVRSSNVDAYDQAALYAVNSAPNIPAVGKFLSKPKTFVVGYIFQ